jgi:hypothetical protein
MIDDLLDILGVFLLVTLVFALIAVIVLFALAAAKVRMPL